MTKKIIIADHLRYIFKKGKILKRINVQIFAAKSADEAFRIHKREKVNLIITDSKLPGIRDNGFCSSIRSNRALKKVSILMLCEKGNSNPCDCSGVNEFITKPVSPEILSEKLNRLLNIQGRMDLRARIRIGLKGNFANEFFICKTLNISSSGLLIETGKLLSKGNVISCTFSLPEIGTIVSDGEVVRTVKDKIGKNQYGIKFVNMDKETRSILSEFIQKLSLDSQEALAY